MDAVEESETMPMGERKTMRQGGDLGENGRAMEEVAPLYMMGRFGHVHGHVLPHDHAHMTAVLHAPTYMPPHTSELTVKGIDPTATSVITCFEDFGQGSGEK